MSHDIFLNLEGIEGESSDDKHPGWIELESFNLGATQAGSVGEQGGTGKVSYTNVTVVKSLDISTPNIFLYSARGTHIKTATIEVCQASKDKHVCSRIKLSDVVIASVNLGQGQGTDRLPQEQIQLSFSAIEIEYIPINKEGKPQAARKMNWYLKSNR